MDHRRATDEGTIRHRVKSRVGGRDSRVSYAGSFKRKSDALRRKWK